MKDSLLNMKEPVTIQLEPLDNNQPLKADFDTLIRLFSKFRRSFRSFVEICFLRNEHFGEVYCGRAGIVEEFRKECELNIVFLDIDSLTISFSPVFKDDDFLFVDEVNEWKKETFGLYKQQVIYCDYHSTSFIRNLLQHYQPEERMKIYRPVFDAVSYDKNYKLNLMGPDGKPEGMFIPPLDIIRYQIIPSLKPSEPAVKTS